MSVPGVLLRSTLETHNKLHVNFAVKSLHHMEASSPLKESVEKYLDKDARVSFRVKKAPGAEACHHPPNASDMWVEPCIPKP